MCITVNFPFWRKKRRFLLHDIEWLSSEFFKDSEMDQRGFLLYKYVFFFFHLFPARGTDKIRPSCMVIQPRTTGSSLSDLKPMSLRYSRRCAASRSLGIRSNSVRIAICASMRANEEPMQNGRSFRMQDADSVFFGCPFYEADRICLDRDWPLLKRCIPALLFYGFSIYFTVF